MSAHVAVILNPTKTERSAIESHLSEALGADATVTWFETSEDDAGQTVAAEALQAEPDLLLVAGGDGTVRAVIEHLADAAADVDLGILPLGTGNLLARNLDVPVNDLEAAIDRAVAGAARHVDVGWVDVDLTTGHERHAFVVMVGFGIDAHMIDETDDDLKSKAGWLAYVESLGRAFAASDVVPFHLSVDGQPGNDEEGHTLLIANCGTLPAGLTLLPDADVADGELDYLLLSASSLPQWVGSLKTMVWDNGIAKMAAGSDESTSSDSVTYGRARALHVDLPEPHAFEIDGEFLGDAHRFDVTIQHAAVRVR